MKKSIVFMGIDLGTTGVRVVVSDKTGRVVSTGTAGIEKSMVRHEDPTRSEQNARFWKEPLFNALNQALDFDSHYILRAITVDSTSGTIIPVDRNCNPLRNAMLHNDVRASEESTYINEHTKIRVKPSFALSKILWIMNNEPELFERTYKFLHAADYVKGLICNEFDITDFSNAVKTGYDLENNLWPENIESFLGIPLDKLPRVVKTGDTVGRPGKEASEELHIPPNVDFIAGATDSTTGFYSSGARAPRDWNTTLGTVLAIRGISKKFLMDDIGLLYTHRHPEGYWLPGAASNTGGEAIRLFFGDRLEEYNREIENTLPTGSLVYPLSRKSEKFPFFNIDATGFIDCSLTSPSALFKAFLEGEAFVERMMYEKVLNIGYEVGDRVYSMGGGAYSVAWMQIRADVLNKTICRAREVETGFGAAVIAASGSYYGSMTDAIGQMVNIDRIFEAQPIHMDIYNDIYQKFLRTCRDKGLF
jgi:sugar (pentulose or hexulose) kinase